MNSKGKLITLVVGLMIEAFAVASIAPVTSNVLYGASQGSRINMPSYFEKAPVRSSMEDVLQAILNPKFIEIIKNESMKLAQQSQTKNKNMKPDDRWIRERDVSSSGMNYLKMNHHLKDKAFSQQSQTKNKNMESDDRWIRQRDVSSSKMEDPSNEQKSKIKRTDRRQFILPKNMAEAAEILNISEDAPEEEMASVYKTAAMRAHPDLGGSDEEMAILNEAKNIFMKNYAQPRAEGASRGQQQQTRRQENQRAEEASRGQQQTRRQEQTYKNKFTSGQNALFAGSVGAGAGLSYYFMPKTQAKKLEPTMIEQSTESEKVKAGKPLFYSGELERAMLEESIKDALRG